MNPTIGEDNRKSKYYNRHIPLNKANKERVLEDAEDDDDDSDHEPMTLHLPGAMTAMTVTTRLTTKLKVPMKMMNIVMRMKMRMNKCYQKKLYKNVIY